MFPRDWADLLIINFGGVEYSFFMAFRILFKATMSDPTRSVIWSILVVSHSQVEIPMLVLRSDPTEWYSSTVCIK